MTTAIIGLGNIGSQVALNLMAGGQNVIDDLHEFGKLGKLGTAKQAAELV
jgi:predicted dinucleotide-binding enzyme